jgi:hypothetical protein
MRLQLPPKHAAPAAVQLPSVVPSATAWQVPNDPVRLHELHSAQVLEPQHTLSTQCVLAHSVPAVHVCPPIFLQLPPKQAEPAAVQLPSVVPSATAWQVPNDPVTLHELQSAQVLEPQHLPSTHVSWLSQSVVTVQESPWADLSPHLWVMVLHVTVPEQSVLLLHVLRQTGLVELQTYDPQGDVAAAGHAPLPSQVAAAVRTPAVQLCWRQPVLLDHGWQAPLPSQLPALLQSPFVGSLFAPAQRDFGSEPALSTLEQVPDGAVLVPLQVLHSPPEVASAQAVLQHRPSVQNPLWHWLAAVHAAPLARRPQVSFAQILTPEQSCA